MASTFVSSESVDAKFGASSVVFTALVGITGKSILNKRELSWAEAGEASNCVGTVVRAATLVWVGTFVTFASGSVNEDVVFWEAWADAFISAGEVLADSRGNTTTVVFLTFVDINADIEVFWGTVPCSGSVGEIVHAVDLGDTSISEAWFETFWAVKDGDTTGKDAAIGINSTEVDIFDDESGASGEFIFVWA